MLRRLLATAVMGLLVLGLLSSTALAKRPPAKDWKDSEYGDPELDDQDPDSAKPNTDGGTIAWPFARRVIQGKDYPYWRFGVPVFMRTDRFEGDFTRRTAPVRIRFQGMTFIVYR